MSLQRILQINMATLAALGTLLLGMGLDNPWLALGMVVAAMGAIWLTDITGWLRLPRLVGYFASLAASAACFYQLWPFDIEQMDDLIPTLAYLLVYLQVILLFQEKDDRLYWELMMLSLLEVVVAALFSQGVWFGFLLVVYMLIGSLALTLLCLHRVWSGYRLANQTTPTDPVSQEPTAKADWPLTTEKSTFTSMPSGPDHVGIGRELIGRLSTIALGSAVVTLILFYSVPRTGQMSWRSSFAANPKRLVGFDPEVTLGDLGRIIESPEKVMEVELSRWNRDQQGTLFPYRRPLYLRGAILTHYQDGTWKSTSSGGGAQPKEPPPGIIPLEQRFFVKKFNRKELFSVWPFFGTDPSGYVRYNSVSRQLMRTDSAPDSFQYSLGTAAFSEGTGGMEQTEIVPCESLPDTENLLLLPEPPLSGLEALAKEWDTDEDQVELDRISRAKVLTAQFDNPKRFQYTLDGVERDETIDPIEDFVTKHPQGHCEYFATALAMMLRARGIPSRVVVGYLCDEVNSRGVYQVRQLHAHTWVEAYLRPEDIDRARYPKQLFDDPAAADRWEHGAWLRLEPTKSGSNARLAADRSGFGARLRESLLWLQEFWDTYIVEMDKRRQYEVIYGPIGGFLQLIRRRPALAAVLILAGVLLILAWRRRRRLIHWLFLRRAKHDVSSPSEIMPLEVAFYRRLETLLAQRGLVRLAGQTQREFAADAGQRLAETAGDRRLAALPGRIVEAFYCVRFGRLPLDRSQTETVEQALSELAGSAIAGG